MSTGGRRKFSWPIPPFGPRFLVFVAHVVLGATKYFVAHNKINNLGSKRIPLDKSWFAQLVSTVIMLLALDWDDWAKCQNQRLQTMYYSSKLFQQSYSCWRIIYHKYIAQSSKTTHVCPLLLHILQELLTNDLPNPATSFVSIGRLSF